MAQVIRLPDESDLPPGYVRDFAVLLFYLYRRAHRPALRDISEAIRRDEGLKGTASPETIRRMLKGTSVPAHWATVEAVYLTLCDLAELDPYSDKVKHKGNDHTVRRHIEDAWHAALDDPDFVYPDDSRNTTDGGFGKGSSDEPPWADGGFGNQ